MLKLIRVHHVRFTFILSFNKSSIHSVLYVRNTRVRHMKRLRIYSRWKSFIHTICHIHLIECNSYIPCVAMYVFQIHSWLLSEAFINSLLNSFIDLFMHALSMKLIVHVSLNWLYMYVRLLRNSRYKRWFVNCLCAWSDLESWGCLLLLLLKLHLVWINS